MNIEYVFRKNITTKIEVLGTDNNWTAEERILLPRMYSSGVEIDELANYFKRSEDAVKNQLIATAAEIVAPKSKGMPYYQRCLKALSK